MGTHEAVNVVAGDVADFSTPALVVNPFAATIVERDAGSVDTLTAGALVSATLAESTMRHGIW